MSPSFLDSPVVIDSRLVKSCLWYGLNAAHRGNGSLEVGTQICEEAIQTYKVAIEAKSNQLLWRYSGTDNRRGFFDPFASKKPLPKHILWYLLGEAYRSKGDTEKALHAFHHALAMDKDNLWLQAFLNKLSSNSRV
jgi:tetratricopeptide (TPR) repeat protein